MVDRWGESFMVYWKNEESLNVQKCGNLFYAKGFLKNFKLQLKPVQDIRPINK